MAHCFEIFGADLMQDETGHMWLLEINPCPSLWLSSSVIEDALTLALER